MWVWKKAPKAMLTKMAECFTKCLKEGVFPDVWKRAKLTLIPKIRVQDNGLHKVKPICLLDDLGKILKRIVVRRMHLWMKDHPESGLSGN